MELIKVYQGRQAVSAKELYRELGYDQTHWGRWHKTNIVDSPFATEDVDYTILAMRASTPLGGQVGQDFALSIDFAKKLAMQAKTERGERVRDYFIAMEKVVLESDTPTMTARGLLETFRQIIKHEERITLVEGRVTEVEAKVTTRPDYYSISGYASLIGVPVNHTRAKELGRKAVKMCNEMGFPVDTVTDAKYGTVNTYPEEVLKTLFKKQLHCLAL